MATRPSTDQTSKFISQELRAQRARLGLTLRDLEDATGLGFNTVRRTLAGQSMISVKTLVLLCDAMDLDAPTVLGIAQKRQSPDAATAQ